MASYCSVSDVINVVRLFEGDWEDQLTTVPSTLIEGYIEEASEEVRYILYSRYDLAVIDDLDLLPLAIRYITKIKCAYLVLSRIGPTSVERNKNLKELISPEYLHWYSLVERGLLLNTDGTPVPTKSVRIPETLSPKPNFPGYITNLYTNLPTGQFRRY